MSTFTRSTDFRISQKRVLVIQMATLVPNWMFSVCVWKSSIFTRSTDFRISRKRVLLSFDITTSLANWFFSVLRKNFYFDTVRISQKSAPQFLYIVHVVANWLFRTCNSQLTLKCAVHTIAWTAYSWEFQKSAPSHFI